MANDLRTTTIKVTSATQSTTKWFELGGETFRIKLPTEAETVSEEVELESGFTQEEANILAERLGPLEFRDRTPIGYRSLHFLPLIVYGSIALLMEGSRSHQTIHEMRTTQVGLGFTALGTSILIEVLGRKAQRRDEESYRWREEQRVERAKKLKALIDENTLSPVEPPEEKAI